VRPRLGAACTFPEVLDVAHPARPPVVGICAAAEVARWSFWEQHASIVASSYSERVQAAGAIPVALLPDARVAADPRLVLDRIDALLLIGGADVDPSTYGAPRGELTERTYLERDRFEIALAHAALDHDIPVLGICRGVQILNVARGGTLHQDLGQAGYDEHRPSQGRLDVLHDVLVEPGTLAARLAGDGLVRVNSHHHQGIGEVGEGALVSARSPEGLPEALEWPECRYALGVQWHPEAAALSHSFEDLVAAAATSAAGGRS
jgi:putative glutamine amidotransferase